MGDSLPPLTIAPNWTSAAGALESILARLGAPLPRHAVMGLSGHAWHLCLGTHEGVTALPSGPADIDPEWQRAAYARTGFEWTRFGAPLDGSADATLKQRAVEWTKSHLGSGRPLIGWDFHLHEHAVVYGYDDVRDGFLLSDILTPDLGSFVALADWPSSVGRIELFAPVAPIESDPLETIAASLQAALEAFAGHDGPDGQPRGTAALTSWANTFEGDGEVDRAGNAYTLAVLAAARTDGAAFLADLADSITPAEEALRAASRALIEETRALSPLITLFPFPSGGHGNVANPGLRRAAAMALRRAARHEESAASHIAQALAAIES